MAACTAPAQSTATTPRADFALASSTPLPVRSPTAPPTPSTPPVSSATASPSPTITPSPTPAYTVTETPTVTLTPTYAILRGEVLEQANCRYGPGYVYLYKYGLYPGNTLEVFGRNDQGTWLLVRAIGGTNPCWVRAMLMEVRGDILNLAPTTIPLPQSPYYGPLSGVTAQREGFTVIISWDALYLRAGDDSEWFPYLVEAWLCQDGVLVFTPIGSYETFVTVQDEAGCAEPSHGRVYGVEKHGYTPWVEVPWPQAGE